MVSGFNIKVGFEGTLFPIPIAVRREADVENAVHVRGAVARSLETSHPGLSIRQDGDGQQFIHLLGGQHRQVIAQVLAGEIRPPSVAAPGSVPLGES